MKAQLFLVLACSVTFFSIAKPAHANQPVMEQRQTEGARASDPYQLYNSAMTLGDPTYSSFTVFSQLERDGVDMYYFVPQNDETIPIELLVNQKGNLPNFRPSMVVIGKYIAAGAKNPSEIPVPIGFESLTMASLTYKTISYDTLSLQKYYRGDAQQIHVVPGEVYFLGVYDPASIGGMYAIHLGTKNNFAGSVKDTIASLDTGFLEFENYPSRPSPSAPTLAERKFFPEQKTPFQTLDTKLRLWTDIFFFYLNRIPALLGK